MSQLQPTSLELPVPPVVLPRRRGLAAPAWVRLLLANPKSRAGLAIVLFMIVVAAIAPLISVSNPLDFNLLASKFGTTLASASVNTALPTPGQRAAPPRVLFSNTKLTLDDDHPNADLI